MYFSSMALKNFPLIDIPNAQFRKQFTDTPANIIGNTSAFFKTEKSVFFITEIEAGGAYTLDFININDNKQIRGGSGNTQYYLPVGVKTLNSTAGVTKISGFWLDTDQTN